MKFVIQSAAVLLIAFSTASIAKQPVLSIMSSDSQKQQSSLSAERNQRGGNLEIVFVEGETAVVGLQFDLKLRDAAKAVSACGSLSSGHALTCNDISADVLRVIVFSATNAPIDTGVVLTIPGAGVAKFVEGSVLMGDANAEAVQAEVL